MDIVELQIKCKDKFEKLDLDRKETFPFHLSINNLSNPTVVKVPYSSQINLPRTQTNSHLFSHIWKFDSTIMNFDPLDTTEFRLFVHNRIYQSGNIQLEEVTDEYFKVRLYGGLNNFFYDLDSLPLKNIDLNASHKINVNDVLKPHFRTKDINAPYSYLLSYQGEYDNFDPDKMMTSTGQSAEVFWEVGKAKLNNLSLTENKRSAKTETYNSQFYGEYRSYYQRPMLKVQSIVESIIASMNKEEWTVELDKSEGGFFTDVNPYWTDLWMVCPNYEPGETKASSQFKEKIGYNVDASRKNEYLSSDYDKNIGPTNDRLATIYAPASSTGMTLEVGLKCKFWAVGGMDDKKNEDWLRRKARDISFTATVRREDNDYEVGKIKWKETRGTTLTLNTNRLCNKRPGEFTGTKWDNFVYDSKNGGEKIADNNTWFELEDNITLPASTEPVTYYIDFSISGNTWWQTVHGNKKKSEHNKKYAIDVEFTNGRAVIISGGDSVESRSNAGITLSDIISTNHSCYDFLLSYCKVFGILFDKDPVQKKVWIGTRDKFYQPDQVLDWTNRIDYGKEYTMEPTSIKFRKGVFKWNVKDTKYELKHRQDFGIEYGAHRVDTNYQFGEDEYNYLDGIMFDNCVIATDSSQYYADRSDIQFKDNKELPYFQDVSESKVDVTYPLVFRNGYKTLNRPFLLTDDNPYMQYEGFCWTNYGELMNTYPHAVRTIEKNGQTYSLNFRRPGQGYCESEETKTDGGIYRRYWRSYISDRLNVDCKAFTCYVFIKPEDMTGNILSKFIHINNTIWVVDEVYDYDPLSPEPTKVRLIKVKDIKNYTDLSYVSDDFIIRQGNTEIFNNATGGEPSRIIIGENTTSVKLEVESTQTWSVQSGKFTADPTQADSGTKEINLTLNTGVDQYDVTFVYGNETVTITILRETYVTVEAEVENGTSVTINGLPSPQQVKINTQVVFNATGDNDFRYWDIDGEIIYTQVVTRRVTKNTKAKAYFLASGQVRLYCDDEYTQITGHEKVSNYWVLTIGQSYTFTNSQPNVSGVLFNTDETYSQLGSRSITAENTPTHLYVYYDQVLLNLTVVNKSLTEYFDGNSIYLEDGNFDFTVPPGETVRTTSSFRETGEITFERMDYHYPTFSQRSFNTFGVHSLTITGNRVGWDGDKEVLEDPGYKVAKYWVYGPSYYDLKSGLVLNHKDGTGDREIEIILTGNGGEVVQEIGGFNYTLKLNQVAAIPDIGWTSAFLQTLNVTAAYNQTSYTTQFYDAGYPLVAGAGLTKSGNNVTAVFTENTNVSERILTFYITCNNQQYILTITQAGAPPVINTYWGQEADDEGVVTGSLEGADGLTPSATCAYDIGRSDLLYKDGLFCGALKSGSLITGAVTSTSIENTTNIINKGTISSDGSITAPAFNGALNGNATSATHASTAGTANQTKEALTIKRGSTVLATFNGSEAKEVTIPYVIQPYSAWGYWESSSSYYSNMYGLIMAVSYSNGSGVPNGQSETEANAYVQISISTTGMTATEMARLARSLQITPYLVNGSVSSENYRAASYNILSVSAYYLSVRVYTYDTNNMSNLRMQPFSWFIPNILNI